MASLIRDWVERPLGVLLLVAVLATLSYSNTFSASFHFDDERNIVNNSQVTHLTTGTTAGLRFTGSRDVGFWTFAVNYALGGRNVLGYHLVNLLIHITNGWLVYILVILLLQTPGLGASPPVSEQARWAAVTTALLFVAHPIQTQAVTYIVQRFASLAALFYLVAVVCYLQWRLTPPATRARVAWYAGALLATILAMKTKEISFTLPLMLVLVEGVGFRPKTWKHWRPLVPFLLTLPLIPLAYSGALGEAEVGWARETTEISRWSYLVTQSRVLVTYLRLLLLPIQQNLDYDYPLYESLLAPPVLLSVLGLGSLFGLAVYLLRTSTRWRVVGFGVLWFFLTLAVESSLIPIRDVIVEHRLYLPSMGLLLAGSVVAVDLLARWRGGLVLGIGVVALLALATYQRNRVWHDEVTLWSNVVAGSPQKARPHNNLGHSYISQERLEEAIKELMTALQLQSNHPEAHSNLGAAYLKQGRVAEAIPEFLTAIRVKPEMAEAHNNLGFAYVKQGRVAEAIPEHLTALKLQPNLAEAHNNLGVAYLKQGRVAEAITEHLTALKLNADLPEAHNNLGAAYAEQGRLAEAIQEYRSEITLRPNFADAHYNLGNAYARQGGLEDAVKEYRIGVQLTPNLPDIHNNLGNAYARLGRMEEAIQEFAVALKLNPDLPEVHYNLGAAYAKQGRLDEAIKEYRAAVQLNPAFLEAHYNLGQVYQVKRLEADARKEFEAALKLNPRFTSARQALQSLDVRAKTLR